jgi:hypothetical protein
MASKINLNNPEKEILVITDKDSTVRAIVGDKVTLKPIPKGEPADTKNIFDGTIEFIPSQLDSSEEIEIQKEYWKIGRVISGSIRIKTPGTKKIKILLKAKGFKTAIRTITINVGVPTKGTTVEPPEDEEDTTQPGPAQLPPESIPKWQIHIDNDTENKEIKIIEGGHYTILKAKLNNTYSFYPILTDGYLDDYTFRILDSEKTNPIIEVTDFTYKKQILDNKDKNIEIEIMKDGKFLEKVTIKIEVEKEEEKVKFSIIIKNKSKILGIAEENKTILSKIGLNQEISVIGNTSPASNQYIIKKQILKENLVEKIKDWNLGSDFITREEGTVSFVYTFRHKTTGEEKTLRADLQIGIPELAPENIEAEPSVKIIKVDNKKGQTGETYSMPIGSTVDFEIDSSNNQTIDNFQWTIEEDGKEIYDTETDKLKDVRIPFPESTFKPKVYTVRVIAFKNKNPVKNYDGHLVTDSVNIKLIGEPEEEKFIKIVKIDKEIGNTGETYDRKYNVGVILKLDYSNSIDSFKVDLTNEQGITATEIFTGKELPIPLTEKAGFGTGLYKLAIIAMKNKKEVKDKQGNNVTDHIKINVIGQTKIDEMFGPDYRELKELVKKQRHSYNELQELVRDKKIGNSEKLIDEYMRLEEQIHLVIDRIKLKAQTLEPGETKKGILEEMAEISRYNMRYLIGAQLRKFFAAGNWQDAATIIKTQNSNEVRTEERKGRLMEFPASYIKHRERHVEDLKLP